MKRRHNAPAGETAHQPRFWIDGGDPRQLDLQEQFEQTGQHYHGNLHRYEDAAYLRPATAEELTRSVTAAQRDGGIGAIDVNGVTCYVIGEQTAQDAPQSRQDDAGDVLPADLAAEYRAAVMRLGWICGGDE